MKSKLKYCILLIGIMWLYNPQTSDARSVSLLDINVYNLKTCKMKTKQCSKCKEIKELSEFYKHKGNPDKHSYFCRKCAKKQSQDFHRSKIGLITIIYNSQKQSSKKRGHKQPTYTLFELQNWFDNQKIYNRLYDSWVASGYNKMLTPSCDRDDDYQGYCLTRLTLTTWGKNKDNFNRDVKNGINNKISKAVIATNIKSGTIKTFYSMSEASRETGVYVSNIYSVALGKPKKDGRGHYYTPRTAGGYKWEFKT